MTYATGSSARNAAIALLLGVLFALYGFSAGLPALNSSVIEGSQSRGNARGKTHCQTMALAGGLEKTRKGEPKFPVLGTMT
jgi:hypothetical protein